MLFTRSIQRKLYCGLGLVLAMLGAIALSEIDGLRSHRAFLSDLDYRMNEAPQVTRLQEAFIALDEPLLIEAKTLRQREERAADFTKKLREADSEVGTFLARLRAMPLKSVHKDLAAQRLNPINGKLMLLDGHIPALQEAAIPPPAGSALPPDPAHATVNAMLRLTAEVQLRATKLRDLEDLAAAPHRTLENAEKMYRTHWKIFVAAMLLTAVLLIGLVVSGYRWVFMPIRRLHEGARRVAQGDFSYRVELQSQDEMSELADAFNQMTQRFQEIAEDLDRQVQERSRQLVRSERLAGVGFLAAGVAHEINNPLAAITMATDSLQGRMPDLLKDADAGEATVVHEYLGMIQRESERCRDITAKLLDFSRGREGVVMRCDLNEIVREVLGMVAHLGRYRDREIRFEPKKVCPVEVNAPEIKQVILNLVANALDSLEPGGQVVITTDEVGDQAVVSVTDNGCGMTPDVIDNLFEPFFTTKQPKQGTGLGLSISNRIINDHGGTIEATSDGPGTGSMFRMRLPKRGSPADAAA